MRRRQFIGGLAGAAAWPLAARAQQPERMRRIGVLTPFAADDAEGRARLAAFAQEMQRLGWTIGQNIQMEHRCGDGKAETMRSAADALRTAHTFGVRVTLDGNNLVLEASAPPPHAVLDALSRNKLAILDLLLLGRDGIAQHGRAPRVKANAPALACGVIEWLNQHPASSQPGYCAWCGGTESPGAVVLPFGTEPGTHAWLHAECWAAWHQARPTADRSL